MATETLHFQVHGNYITDLIRTVFAEGSIKKAWDIYETIHNDKAVFNQLLEGTKEFQGINRFTLEDCKKTDVRGQTALYLLRAKNRAKEQINTTEESLFKMKRSGRTIDADFAVDLANSLANEKRELEQYESSYAELVSITQLDKDALFTSCLQPYVSDKLDSVSAWITEKGWFIPVDTAQHEQVISDINDLLEGDNDLAAMEKRWVRVGFSWLTGIAHAQAASGVIKPKQQIKVIQWAETHKDKVFRTEKLVHVFGFGYLELEDGRVRLIKDKGRD